MVASSLLLPNVDIQEGRRLMATPRSLTLGGLRGTLGNEPGVLTVDIDRTLVAKTRATVPVMSQHRDFYP